MITTYTHFALGLGRATAAIRLLDNDTIEVGVALCSPKDQFSKEKGRLIAAGRLDSKRNFYTIVNRNPDEKVKEQVRATIRRLVRGAKAVAVPKWAAKKVLYPVKNPKNALLVVNA